MRTLNLTQCPLCLKQVDYRNMRSGVCRHCRQKIEEGDDATLDRYFAIPLSQITSILIENENLRLGRK